MRGLSIAAFLALLVVLAVGACVDAGTNATIEAQPAETQGLTTQEWDAVQQIVEGLPEDNVFLFNGIRQTMPELLDALDSAERTGATMTLSVQSMDASSAAARSAAADSLESAQLVNEAVGDLWLMRDQLAAALAKPPTYSDPTPEERLQIACEVASQEALTSIYGIGPVTASKVRVGLGC